MSSECVFCEIMAGRAPGDVVYEDALTVAFIDPRQHHPGHVLVVPRTHINDIRQLAPPSAAALMATMIRMARAVDRAFPNEGLSLVLAADLVAAAGEADQWPDVPSGDA
jgi:histidine triad (HIT) family protein